MILETNSLMWFCLRESRVWRIYPNISHWNSFIPRDHVNLRNRHELLHRSHSKPDAPSSQSWSMQSARRVGCQGLGNKNLQAKPNNTASQSRLTIQQLWCKHTHTLFGFCWYNSIVKPRQCVMRLIATAHAQVLWCFWAYWFLGVLNFDQYRSWSVGLVSLYH